MDFSSVNWLAVIVCVVVAMVSGFVWYHPSVFFKAWWRGIGKGDSDPGDPNPMIYLFTLIAAFVEATFVSILLGVMGSNTLGMGLQAGFLIWLGFVAPTNLVNKLFAGHGFDVWLIEAGNHLVNLLLFGAILAVWR
ncbi:MAG: DUF1761 domain-containing protein [Anaerolineales bacterium]|nr:DUF1761 domain-containing protein [Anaerolineales bacterium]